LPGYRPSLGEMFLLRRGDEDKPPVTVIGVPTR